MEKFYHSIFEQTYQMKIEEVPDDLCILIQKSVSQLRTSYRNDYCVTEYERDNIRNAYMISYFPHYVDPSYRICIDIILPHLKDSILFQKNLNLSYFAGGPCPELFGTVKALDEIGFHKKINATILDYEKEWEEQRRITTRLMKSIYPSMKLNIRSMSGCNILQGCLKCVDSYDYCKDQIFAETDLYFMQNFMTHVNDKDRFIESMLNKLMLAKSGSIFSVIDLNYSGVRENLKLLLSGLNSSVCVLASNLDRDPDTTTFVPPKEVDRIFTGENNLMRKKNTRYYYVVMQRI